jgi:hypothetical protein
LKGVALNLVAKDTLAGGSLGLAMDYVSPIVVLSGIGLILPPPSVTKQSRPTNPDS